MAVSPAVVSRWLEQRHGGSALSARRQRSETVVKAATAWDRAMTDGTAKIVYRFDHEFRGTEHVRIEDGKLLIGCLAPIFLLD
jgi:hypothetical protein